ncbi:MFS transporter, UMF1 family [Austwickia chelonae]|uniref:Putative major facilitator superfamily transporter n=1 Tax=Austwickia chelonae NBRC 105200 TaxID=1184607 RepID=K6W6D3_9MICO|nr:MFS transporter [Austwickia chelonae]GAB77392.1 putative major facilitator superfamily transporter [Austwickia chelonae NBRC 105200]SEW09427.1 MFS transporter, UMF1 family [Austwickia chelonae]
MPSRRLFNRESLAWIGYDLGTNSFHSVVVTFVFSVYLTSSAFGPADANSEALGTGMSIAAIFVALLAPVLGHRSDRANRPVFWLGVNSFVVLCMILSLFFVRPDPSYLWPGIVLLVIATVFAEFASVNHNSLLKRVSTPETVGKISAFGWGSGYLGSIAVLLFLLLAFIQPEQGLFGVTHEDGMHIRASMLFTAAWYTMGMIPVLVVLRKRSPKKNESSSAEQVTPETTAEAPLPKESIIGSYAALGRTLRSLAKDSPNTLYFLIASAIFRDGLVGVFAFGGVIAYGTFGFTSGDVVTFAVVANLTAGLATVSSGILDDKVGPKRLILGSLICMICAGVGIFALHDGGPIVFWVLGLVLCIFVGPAQSASRTLLIRLIPHGREGEIFGLYATTGRALSFIAPAAFTGAIMLGRWIRPQDNSTQYWGILGITAVLLIGLLALVPVKAHRDVLPENGWSPRKTPSAS